MNILRILLIAFLSQFIFSCAVMPTFTEKFDKNCQSVQKKVELSVKELEMFGDLECSDKDDCKAQFLGEVLGSVITFPITAIISGSIAVVGNSIYWVNEYGECRG